MNLSPLNINDFPEDRHFLVRAILKFGGHPSGFARLLGIPHQTVRQWLTSKNNSISPKYCPQIEKLTFGEITKEQLRPDIFGPHSEPYPSIETRLQKCILGLSEISLELSKNNDKRS